VRMHSEIVAPARSHAPPPVHANADATQCISACPPHAHAHFLPPTHPFHPPHPHPNLVHLWREELLACLRRQHSIVKVEGTVAKGAAALPRCKLLDLSRQSVLLHHAPALPGGKVARLPAPTHAATCVR
jgi:hypothetical protein